jgi:acyl-CoA thioesterase I
VNGHQLNALTREIDEMSQHIICFGDSLTAGFQSPTRERPTGQETPYGAFLQEWLGGSIRIRVSGICGELTGEMAMRFRQDVLAHQPGYVVILGGTNDLGWNAQPPDIMRNLLKMYELARTEHVIPVPVTVPSIRVETDGGGPDAGTWVQDHLDRRMQLNALIRQYADSKNLLCIDLFGATAEPVTRQLAAPYSNDGLHLTTLGYRRLAELLFDQVFAGAFPDTPGRRQ